MYIKFVCGCLCAVLAAGTVSACAAGNLPAEAVVETESGNTSDSDEAVRLLVERYRFKEEDLDGIDAEAFVDDYGLRDMDYTAEEVWRIFEENRDYYLVTETDGVFALLAPTDEIPENGPDLKTDSDIVSIGFYENPGSLQRSVFFDLDSGFYYVDDAVPHELDEESVASLRNICVETPVCSWKHLNTEKKGSSTGSYAWKIVFLLRDGTKCIYGGWTDEDNLPAGYGLVKEIFSACIS